MKLGPGTKQYKRNKATSENLDDVMSASCNVSVVFPISDKFGANPEA